MRSTKMCKESLQVAPHFQDFEVENELIVLESTLGRNCDAGCMMREIYVLRSESDRYIVCKLFMCVYKLDF